tara:strand:- start:58 stop:2127 length:2070 start_codon:yes stop_codon:yes gene_type:complete
MVRKNRLSVEKSPYLLQHSLNPVDWYPWGEEAFIKAKNEDKLLLVSIGYATCHWCHVMERESFEDKETADYLNSYFISIKVDREERPDIDKIYMGALHALGQQGGWPLNVFVTPEGKPFTGGTYFPPMKQYGRPSFLEILKTITDIWHNDRERIFKNSESISDHLIKNSRNEFDSNFQLNWELENKAVKYLIQAFDEKEGGFIFHQQNKFPPFMNLQLLLRHHYRTGSLQSLEIVEFTIKKMISGGIYDQIGGGLSRYSTDHQWHVPHFEKMLYDNAMLVWTLIDCFQITGNQYYKSISIDVLSYLERDMLSNQGGFYSAEDADSEGVEGKFYVWEKYEILEILGEDLGEQACEYWNIEEKGSFEGKNIPRLDSVEISDVAKKFKISEKDLINNLEIARDKLFEKRTKRIRPICDDKIITSWNALIISAFARASRVFEELEYNNIAVMCANFLWNNMNNENMRLHRRWREGEKAHKAYLVDYVQLALSYIDLYETNYDPLWSSRAMFLMEKVDLLFKQNEGPYFDTGSDAEKLLTRTVDSYDGVEPSGNSTAALVFQKMQTYGISSKVSENALRIFKGFSKQIVENGLNMPVMLEAIHFYLGKPKGLVICGDKNSSETKELLKIARHEYHPSLVTAFVPHEIDFIEEMHFPILQGRKVIDGKATAFVCIDQTCKAPVHNAVELKEQLKN